MKSILEYTDFRAYLKDFIQDRHQKNLPVSNRWFALKMGINSNAWLTYVLQGKRNLNDNNIIQLISLFKFKYNEGRYFKTLVKFNQVKTIEERNRYYKKLEIIRKGVSAKIVSSDQYEFYSVWHHSAIRSIIDMYPDFSNYEELGSMVIPSISPAEVKKSIDLLERLGLIEKDEKGLYRVMSKAITSGDHEKALAIANFQRGTMKLAFESLDRFNKEERDVSTMTIGISGDALVRIKALLAETRKKISEIATEDSGSDRVYQLNLQLFPFSKKLPVSRGEKKE